MKTNGELSYLAQKYGWKAETLTRARINRMPADESDWHSRFNADEFTRAWGEDQAKAENKKNTEAAKSQRIWKNEATNEETEESIREVQEFVAAYPQFRADFVPNREALISFLRSKTLSCVKANLVAAFEDLASKGFLLLNPSAIGIGEESEISGGRVVRHPELYKLLAPAPAEKDRLKLAEQKMSADEYRKQHPEAFRDPRVYAEAAEKIKREINSFRSFHPEYLLTEENSKHLQAYISKRKLPFNRESLEAAYGELVRQGYIEINHETVVSSGGTKLVDFGGRPGRANLSREINRMSAAEYAEFIANPTNRRSIDEALR